jgi:hypothetical protein
MAEAKSTTKPFGNQAANQGAFAKELSDQTKDLAQKTTESAHEATKDFEQAYSSVAKDAAEFNRQWFEMMRGNASSTIEFMQQLAGVKSPTEFLELSTIHSRKQFETFTEQSQQLMSLAQKVTNGAIAPVQAGMKKHFIAP